MADAAPRYLREKVLPSLERGAARAGRSASEVELRINCLSATGIDARATSESREKLRSTLATPSMAASTTDGGWYRRPQ